MGNVNEKELTAFIETVIETFHKRRIESLGEISLTKILSRKNPYLFRAKNILTAEELVKGILDAHLSSQEEAIFGTVLESLAIYIAGKSFNGRKSSAEGIDLEFERDGIVYLVAIKSGPNWGNSGQIAKMRDNFKKAKRILGTNTSRKNIVCVNGCCYGRTTSADQSDYQKLCGKEFWEFVSGSERLYLDIIKPIGHKAKEKNDSFLKKYAAVINKFVGEFISTYCDVEGKIMWEKIVQLSSSKSK
jgi:Type II restriction endonuclease EcoO109I